MNHRNIHIISLGCPKNLVDSEVMAALLAKSGYRITSQADDAHIILINTCAFILSAKEESIDEILKMAEWKKKQRGACTHLVVTGCLPQRYGKGLERELPEVDLFLGVGEVGNIVHHLDSLSQTEVTGPPLHHRQTRLPDECANSTPHIDALLHQLPQDRRRMFQSLLILCNSDHTGKGQEQGDGRYPDGS